jgi:hypothetical protein
MARIRSIKPEFPQSETVGRLSRDARLLFIQLWTIVDDSGRARAASRMLASLLYPYDDDATKLISKWLDELEREGCIRRYEVDGKTYLDVPKWLEHQKIDKPSKSRLPEFREPSAKPREASRSLDADLGPRTLDQDLGPRNSEAVASADEVVGEDNRAKLFRIGKTILVSFGVTEKRTGALIGQWLKARNDPVGLLAAIQFARDQNVAEPVAYISTLLSKHGGRNGQAKSTLTDLAFDLAEQARERERAAGLHRPDDAVGSH